MTPNAVRWFELVSAKSQQAASDFQLSAEPNDHDCHIDAVGLVCPEPLMIVRNRVRKMQPGEVLFVVATDPSTDRDFRDFCRFMGHELLSKAQIGDRLEYRIRKGA